MKTRDIVTGVTIGVAVMATLLLGGCVTKSIVIQGDLKNGMDIVNNTDRIDNLESQVSNILRQLEINNAIEAIEYSDDIEIERVEIPPPAKLKEIEL